MQHAQRNHETVLRRGELDPHAAGEIAGHRRLRPVHAPELAAGVLGQTVQAELERLGALRPESGQQGQQVEVAPLAGRQVAGADLTGRIGEETDLITVGAELARVAHERQIRTDLRAKTHHGLVPAGRGGLETHRHRSGGAGGQVERSSSACQREIVAVQGYHARQRDVAGVENLEAGVARAAVKHGAVVQGSRLELAGGLARNADAHAEQARAELRAESHLAQVLALRRGVEAQVHVAIVARLKGERATTGHDREAVSDRLGEPGEGQLPRVGDTEVEVVVGSNHHLSEVEAVGIDLAARHRHQGAALDRHAAAAVVAEIHGRRVHSLRLGLVAHRHMKRGRRRNREGPRRLQREVLGAFAQVPDQVAASGIVDGELELLALPDEQLVEGQLGRRHLADGRLENGRARAAHVGAERRAGIDAALSLSESHGHEAHVEGAGLTRLQGEGAGIGKQFDGAVAVAVQVAREGHQTDVAHEHLLDRKVADLHLAEIEMRGFHQAQGQVGIEAIAEGGIAAVEGELAAGHRQGVEVFVHHHQEPAVRGGLHLEAVVGTEPALDVDVREGQPTELDDFAGHRVRKGQGDAGLHVADHEIGVPVGGPEGATLLRRQVVDAELGRGDALPGEQGQHGHHLHDDALARAVESVGALRGRVIDVKADVVGRLRRSGRDSRNRYIVAIETPESEERIVLTRNRWLESHDDRVGLTGVEGERPLALDQREGRGVQAHLAVDRTRTGIEDVEAEVEKLTGLRVRKVEERCAEVAHAYRCHTLASQRHLAALGNADVEAAHRFAECLRREPHIDGVCLPRIKEVLAAVRNVEETTWAGQ